MDESEENNVRMNKSYYDQNLISEVFNSISKMQNQELILKQMNPVSMNQSSMYKAVNLAAALHDHISCTKLQPDLFRSDDGLFTLSFNSTSRQQQKEIDNKNGFLKNFGGSEQENTFKDIILVQLDLIQHQQEQLLKKERQLQSARQDCERQSQDCEALYKRLDSMEKEIMNLKDQLLRKNESSGYLPLNKDLNDGLDNQLTFCNFLTDPSNLLNTTTSSSVVYQSSDQFNLNKSPTLLPRLSADELDQLDLNNVETVARRTEDNNKKRKKNNDNTNGSKNDKKVNAAKKKITGAKRSSSTVTGSGGKKTCTNKQKNSHQSVIDCTVADEQRIAQLPIKTIETDYPYEIVTNKDFFNSLDDEDNPGEQSKSNQQSNIEIPSWRVYPISCSYSLEGTECLHDDVFYRRHSKLELDEKRRKRWDQQRLRELKNNERLRGRYSSKIVNNLNSSISSQLANNNDSSEEAPGAISSFYPAPNILKFIEITDKLPVVAFGYSIPEIPKKNLTLPWNNKSTTNNNNSKSNKGVKGGKKS